MSIGATGETRTHKLLLLREQGLPISITIALPVGLPRQICVEASFHTLHRSGYNITSSGPKIRTSLLLVAVWIQLGLLPYQEVSIAFSGASMDKINYPPRFFQKEYRADHMLHPNNRPRPSKFQHTTGIEY